MRRMVMAAVLGMAACVTVKPAPPLILAGATGIPETDPVAAASVIIMGEGGRLMGDGFCNGVVIRDKPQVVILTAAHCLRSTSRPYFVTTTEYWRQAVTPNPEDDGYHPFARPGVRIERFLFHPKFERDFSDHRHTDDLALALLEGGLPGTARPAVLAAAKARLMPAKNAAASKPKTHDEFWNAYKPSQVTLGVYCPYGVYTGFDTFYTKHPLAFLGTLKDLNMLALLPQNPHMIIRGNSGGGVYVSGSKGPELIGILIATSDSDAFQEGDAMDLRAYQGWIASGIARLDLDHGSQGR